MGDGDDGARVEARVRRWVREAVIGLRLCPFAAPVEETLAVVVSEAGAFDDAVRDALGAAEALLSTPAIPTTLVVYPAGLSELDELLDVADALEGALEATGADDLLQVASFHPAYRFDGTAPGDVGNYTNRAPYPAVHLLRVADVTAAIASHPDPEGIPADNIARLEALGAAALAARWAWHREDDG